MADDIQTNDATRAGVSDAEASSAAPRKAPERRTDFPREYRPVLALIYGVYDLGTSQWREVVFYNYEAERWESYAGSKTFSDGEEVIRWIYADGALP